MPYPAARPVHAIHGSAFPLGEWKVKGSIYVGRILFFISTMAYITKFKQV